MAQLILFNKPFGVLSQFTDTSGRDTLANYVSIKDVYAAGRLDKDSEGLLLLTDDGTLQNKIANPKNKLAKYYWAQVEGTVDDEAIRVLQDGVNLKDGLTWPADVCRIDEPAGLWSRSPPIRIRQSIPTQWLEIVIREGKNRQVRRMTAAVGCPTLRLIRFRIGGWQLDQLLPGESKLLRVNSNAADDALCK